MLLTFGYRHRPTIAQSPSVAANATSISTAKGVRAVIKQEPKTCCLCYRLWQPPCPCSPPHVSLPSVSRKHAEIECQCTGASAFSSAFIVDNDSKFGTLVSGTRVQGRRALHDGDIITIGQVRLPPPPPPPPSPPPPPPPPPSHPPPATPHLHTRENSRRSIQNVRRANRGLKSSGSAWQ